MTRLLLFLVHNWPLKLAAIALATLLYGVFVITQDSRQIPVTIPITAQNQPDDLVLTSNLGDVRTVRYFASDDVGPVTSTSFQATVDFTSVPAGRGSVVLGVIVTPIDPRINVFGWEPRQISVTVDDRVTRPGIPVEVVRLGDRPSGLDVRPARLDQEAVAVRGASADVERVDRVEARVQIEPTGLDIDREVDLVPVDAQGETIQQVDVDPPAVRVRIAVFKDGQTRTVPVTPRLGDPAPGFEIARVRVDPPAVTIEGDGEQLQGINRVETETVALAGATEGFERQVALVLPRGVLPVDASEVSLRVTLRPVSETRTFTAGVVLDGARTDRTYSLSTGSVLVTIGGSVADLDRLPARTLTVHAPVAELDTGVHEVELSANLPAGLELEAASPPVVTVTIDAPQASPAEGASPVPAASP